MYNTQWFLRAGQGGALVTGETGEALTFQPDGTVHGGGASLQVLMSSAFSAARNQEILQNALDRGGTLEIGNGTFALLGNLVMSSNTHLRMAPGCVLDISAAGAVDCLRAFGTEAATTALTVDAAKGATSVTLADASNLSPRDWFRVASNAVFDASSTNSKIGEFVEVKSVAGNVVTLEAPLAGGPYLVADTAVASKVTWIENVRVSGGKVLGGGTPTSAGVDTDCNGVRIWRGRDCIVEWTQFERCDLSGVWLQDCIFTKVVGCDFRDAVNDQQAYGVLIDNACQDCEVVGLTAARVRHIVTTGNSTTSKGVGRRITFSHCHCYSTTPARGGGGGDAFDTHTAAENIKFVKCVSYFSTGAGFNIELPLVTLEDCESYNSTDAGFVLHNESDQEAGFILTNCRAVRSGAEGYRITHPTRGSVARVRFAKLTGCSAEDTTGVGIFVANSVSALTLRNVTLKGCVVVGCKSANASVWVQNVLVGDVDVNVSEPTQVAAQLIRVRDCVDVKVSGVLRHADAATGICVYINSTTAGACQKVFVQGVQAGGNAPVGLRGVFADTNAQNCRLGVNDLQECNTPLDLQSGTGHRIYQQPTVSGNNGDTSPTLTVNSARTQLFNSPISANRTVTAPTASLCDGLEFDVVRTAAATGAFNLTVFGGKVLPAGSAVTYRYSSSLAAFVEVSFSTL